ncbi:hypothetical protein PR202_ga07438 [Eleusine coracana subsp. coracana]|uniref:Transducin/WD40 repeat-like superfamily protein n=1 Tax=Eleusine coracana subsp. coracana TaxID=191504 RepID=A0AAV5BXJ7_ELECO|nr:hypothetical protein PR202_ga07438 [Eleusine coracana subsp. coracana]
MGWDHHAKTRHRRVRRLAVDSSAQPRESRRGCCFQGLGSADKTVKFWDLETFELIGSSGSEANVVRSMKFHSDGKRLFCGLHEILKVLSWEPIVCHGVADVGWSTLADLTVDEGKLLGCSYNQNCIGVWVVNLMRTEPYVVGSAESHLTGSINRPVRADSSISSVFDRLSIFKNPANEIAPNTQLKRSMSASKEILVLASSTLTKRLSKVSGTIDLQLTRFDSVPLLFPGVRLDPHSLDDNKRQQAAVEPLPNVCERIFQSKPISAQRNNTREMSGNGEDNLSMSACTESVNSNETGSWYDVSGFEKRNSAGRRTEFANTNRSGVIRLSKLMELSGRHGELRPSSSNFDKIQYESTLDGSIGDGPFMLPGAEENECQPHVADKAARRGWEIGTGAEPLSSEYLSTLKQITLAIPPLVKSIPPPLAVTDTPT